MRELVYEETGTPLRPKMRISQTWVQISGLLVILGRTTTILNLSVLVCKQESQPLPQKVMERTELLES